ncbi:hypothetical protein GGR57DRAFT_481064 [Xylariaceae sp. FL1272]|nr:hypothetical protein GGR57DRAFT_481064 [Xylariaceae sp. FL1272]
MIFCPSYSPVDGTSPVVEMATNSTPLSQRPHPRSTCAKWWCSGNPCRIEELSDAKFDARLGQFSPGQQTSRTGLSINVVILTRKPTQGYENGMNPFVNYYKRLVKIFDFPSSLTRETQPNIGYHRFIKTKPKTEGASELVFAVQSPSLRDEDHSLAMKISLTGTAMSTICIVSVPSKEDGQWLVERIKELNESENLTTRPFYLLNVLCEKLGFDNEKIISDVFRVFQEHDRKMENICAKRSINTATGCTRPRKRRITTDGQATTDDQQLPTDERIVNETEEHLKAIIELNKTNIKLLTLSYTIDFQLSALEFTRRAVARYDALHEAFNPHRSSLRMSEVGAQNFFDATECLTSRTRLAQAMRASALQRAEHWVSLLRASNSQRDMELSKETSKFSRRISLQARNITILGSLFIPPSFVATIFGTNVLTFNRRTGNIAFPKQGWILAASAGGLTVIVVLIMAFCVWPEMAHTPRERRCPLSTVRKNKETDEEIAI